MPYFRQRGNSWSFTVDIGRDPYTNRRKQKVITGFKTEGEARIACEKFLKELEQGKRHDHITLGRFIDEYYETEVKHQIQQSSYQTQKIWARDYIVPKLGNLRLDRITHAHVVKFYNALLTEGVHRGTIKNIAMVLKKTLKAAVVWDYITKNPAAYASPPSYKAQVMKVWTQEQINQFLACSTDKWLHTLYCVALTTGMRLGEMLALTWEDIDFKKHQISVTKSLKYTKAQGLHVKEPKNSNAFRNIIIPQFTIDKLLQHREKQLEGVQIVFDNIAQYIYPTDAWREFQNDCTACEVPTIRIHDLRHTHATHLLQKYPVKVVAERLGDTSNTVLNTYAHVLPTMQKDVADHLNELFKPVDNVDKSPDVSK